MKVTVRINGTNENPWHKFHLTMNPFPQIAKFELHNHMMAINRLDGDPISSPEEIETILQQGFSKEFITLCKRQFRKGERVEFDVVWNGE